MKKIMFNDEFRLTQAVLEGRKTMTRRIIKCPRTFRGEWVAGFNIHRRHSDKKIVDWPCMYDADEREFDMGEILPKYELGEVVAIAQSYKDSGYYPDSLDRHPKDLSIRGLMKDSAGWNNKMFVKSYACRHHIKIVNVKIERLQDISDEDCLKEGIVKQEVISDESPFLYAYDAFLNGDNKYFASRWFKTPKEAFAALIDKVSGKGTWESNPFVFAYEFVLVD
ncbi:hypothetical protein [Bacteroides xylanisolvens]|uniref:ASCH domain-containing protein n=1 Tax=Bacteroides xylanisolvens TaxID=371601 RepID=A0A1Y4V3H2_9BACE|nr:hypothetical protein [Bacteroides xylanisolvens]OUQ64592.1 hypothetical protein B5E52_16790 [Bacteroides xylanisolvens]